MIVEIISTGTELLLGQIINTNAPYLARRLNQLGFNVLFQSTIGDNRERMAQVIANALSRADIIITTGGLGPTQGDITKEVCAQVINRRLILHAPTLDRIKNFFSARNIYMPESNVRQAMIPEEAIVIDNDRGTAPGVIVPTDNQFIIHLPGPPHEMEWMFEHSIVPFLKNKFGQQGAIVSKVLRTYGIGESALEEKIKDLIKAQTNPTIALLARNGEIHIRLTAKGQSEYESGQLIAELEEKIRHRINPYIFGSDDETLEMVVGQLLISNKFTIALAESCTGGLVTSRLTDVPGSSKYLVGSIICYSNKIKTDYLGVPAQVIAEYGAVSEKTAGYMAQGIRNKFATNLGIGITGIAGPDGGTLEKPVGLVYIAVAGQNGLRCFKHIMTGQRTGIKNRIALTTLDIIRRYGLEL